MKPPADLDHFWVITALSNPSRFRRRYELYRPFADMCAAAGINLITVEQAFGQRPFMVTHRSNRHHVMVTSENVLWYKENLLNLGIARARDLDPLLDKVAWIDYDIYPMRSPRDWFEETWHELQHYKFVQMFEEFFTLDSNHNVIGGPSKSFMGSYFKLDMHGPMPDQYCRDNPIYCYANHTHHRHNIPGATAVSSGNLWYGPPGGAWAADVSALDEIGMLPDFCILGSGDWHLATALVSAMNPKDPEMVTSKYAEKLFEIQTRCDRWIKQDVGVVKGGVMHYNHGPVVNRNYMGRKQILTSNHYDPAIDIKYDHHGQLQLETHTPRQIRLRNQIRAYFNDRNEDMLEFKK